jgi:hypothetical protein
MTRVYIPNRGPHDYTEAEQYGRLVYCTEGSLDKFDVSQMFRELDDCFRNASPDDYILLTSLTSLCSVACAIFANKFGRLNLLIHRGQGYVERTLVLNRD